MAWANATLIEQLAGLPPEALDHAAPGSDDWSAGKILTHLVGAAGFYAVRLEGTTMSQRPGLPTNADEVRALGALCAEFDARLRVQAGLPEAIVTHVRNGETIHRARSTILAQSIHHATEHRAQIAGALAAHGVHVVDLDALDVWAYGDAEGLGA
jgi:uncharacterized damage-inducible protein DinB